MNAIRLIGDVDTVRTFALGGVPGSAGNNPDHARAALAAVVAEVEAAGGAQRCPIVVLVTHRVAEQIRAEVDAVVLSSRGPLILEIPGLGEADGRFPLASLIHRALGVPL